MDACMEQIIVTRLSGATYNLISRKDGVTVTKCEQKMTLCEEDTVSITVESPIAQDYNIGDWITIIGRVYRLNQPPKIQKTSTNKFTYDLTFEGVQYDLSRATYALNIDTTSLELQDIQADYLIGDLQRFGEVLIANANRVFPGCWVLGDCPATEEDKNLSFSEDDNCLSVLQTLCDEFDTEFEITQSNGVNTLHFRKRANVFSHTLQYGRGKGLYEISRDNVSTDNMITRLWAFGSTTNITSYYRANRLCMLNKNKSNNYIEQSAYTDIYGIWEGKKYFDDIYPKRTGTVEAPDATYPRRSDAIFYFKDSTMFDLNDKYEDTTADYNEYLTLTGQTDSVEVYTNYQNNVVGNTKYLLSDKAKVSFTSGNLAGYEFEISSYDHTTKTFKIVEYVDENDYHFPSAQSAAFQFAVGDEYVLTNITMPLSYITDAEIRLRNTALVEYAKNCQPQVSYTIKIFRLFLEAKYPSGYGQNLFFPGDSVHIVDSDILVDKTIRIQEVTRDLMNPFEYELKTSDISLRGRLSRVQIVREQQRQSTVLAAHNLTNGDTRVNRTTQFNAESRINPYPVRSLSVSESKQDLDDSTTKFLLTAAQNFVLYTEKIIKDKETVVEVYNSDIKNPITVVLSTKYTEFKKTTILPGTRALFKLTNVDGRVFADLIGNGYVNPVLFKLIGKTVEGETNTHYIIGFSNTVEGIIKHKVIGI